MRRFVIVAVIFSLGWITRGFAEPPPRVELRRIEVPAILPAATYFQCPVTVRKIAEWREACKTRARTESIKPKGE
jgi:hypothetical protein